MPGKIFCCAATHSRSCNSGSRPRVHPILRLFLRFCGPFKNSGKQAVKTRRLTLDERMDLVQQSMGMLLNNTPWHMPVTEKPVLNTTEIWELVNLTEDAHPIHLHLVGFRYSTAARSTHLNFRTRGPSVSPGRRFRQRLWRAAGRIRFARIRA